MSFIHDGLFRSIRKIEPTPTRRYSLLPLADLPLVLVSPDDLETPCRTSAVANGLAGQLSGGRAPNTEGQHRNDHGCGDERQDT